MNVKILLPAVAAAELCALSGCRPVGAKSTSMAVIYSATAVLAAILLVGYSKLGVSCRKELKEIYTQLNVSKMQSSVQDTD